MIKTVLILNVLIHVICDAIYDTLKIQAYAR